MKVSTEYWRCKPTHRAFIFRCTLKGHKWQAGPVQPYRLVACNPGLVFFLFPLPPAVQKIRGPVWQKCGKQHGNRTNYCHRYDIGQYLQGSIIKFLRRLLVVEQALGQTPDPLRRGQSGVGGARVQDVHQKTFMVRIKALPKNRELIALRVRVPM